VTLTFRLYSLTRADAALAGNGRVLDLNLLANFA